MVEVFSSNFEEILPIVKEELKNASFIAIDNEFTGLLASSIKKSSLFDSIESHYVKLRDAASSFIICQLGLSIYTRCKFKNMYTVRTFNFYVRPYSCGSIDRRFLCQASSIDFLCRYNFDFNKFLLQGIPYLSEVEEEQLRREISNGAIHIYHERNHFSASKADQDMVLSAWLPTAKEGDELILEPYIGSHEYFQLHELRLKYSSIWAISRNEEIVVQKVSLAERQKLEQSVAAEEERVLQFYIGFSKVFKALVMAKKPLVGHNMLTDLLLIYGSFYRPLPKTYSEFKRSIHNLFPAMYDTKHIWLNMKKVCEIEGCTRNCGLLDLYILLKRPPKHLLALYSPSIHPINCKIYESDDFPHDAGFDSFATGFVFVKISHLLGMSNCNRSSLAQPLTFKEHLACVKPFENKLNVIKAKLHYIDLERDDPTSHRPEWLHLVAKSEKSLDSPKIIQELSKFGYVELKLINKKKALLAASHGHCAKQILKAFRNHEDFVVSRYSPLRHSTPLRATLWLTCFLSGSLSIVLIVKLMKDSR